MIGGFGHAWNEFRYDIMKHRRLRMHYTFRDFKEKGEKENLINRFFCFLFIKRNSFDSLERCCEYEISINATPKNLSSRIFWISNSRYLDQCAQKLSTVVSETTDAISGRLFEARRTYDLYVWSLYKDSPGFRRYLPFRYFPLFFFSLFSFPFFSFLLFFFLSVSLLVRYVCDQG